MQIIGHHTEVDEPLAQGGEGIHRIIHVLQQYGLVENRDSGAHQPPQRRATFTIQFVGMIGMDNDDRRRACIQENGDQPVGHPIGKHDRQARMDTQSLHMPDSRDSAAQCL